ncbi:uncharacterized protein [Montipora foliosa]|uniref:uncharacterized protein isoform X1 n=1 Tax=Montipora foliosa TaxID=591990 RepID=UPI0035F219BE
MPPLENCYVCSEHFSAESFEVNLRAQITGVKCKRRLKEDAIPTEFCFRPPAKRPRLSSENRLRRRSHEEAVTELLKPDNGLSTPAQSTLTPAQEPESNMELLEYSAPHNAPPSVSRFEECRSLSDTATQCCFDPIILVSVATQTDDVPTTVASDNSSNGSSQVKTQAKC